MGEVEAAEEDWLREEARPFDPAGVPGEARTAEEARAKMLEASEKLDFESAAHWRDVMLKLSEGPNRRGS